MTASWTLSKPAPLSPPESSGSPKAARHHPPTIRLRHSKPSAFTLALPPPTTITPTTTIKMMIGAANSLIHPPPPALPHAAAHYHISIQTASCLKRETTAPTLRHTTPHPHHPRTRYISCTPLLGSDDEVGVWIVTMVENEQVTGTLAS